MLEGYAAGTTTYLKRREPRRDGCGQGKDWVVELRVGCIVYGRRVCQHEFPGMMQRQRSGSQRRSRQWPEMPEVEQASNGRAIGSARRKGRDVAPIPYRG